MPPFQRRRCGTAAFQGKDGILIATVTMHVTDLVQGKNFMRIGIVTLTEKKSSDRKVGSVGGLQSIRC